MAKLTPERRHFLRHSNHLWRILRKTESLIQKEWPLFGLAGVPENNQLIVDAAIRSPQLLLLVPECQRTRELWGEDGLPAFLEACRATTLFDLSIGVALYRIGPLEIGVAREYISGRRRVIVHPALDAILSRTNGFLIFQDQVIEVLLKVAEFSLHQAHSILVEIKKRDGGNLKSIGMCLSRKLSGRGLPRVIAEIIAMQIVKEGAYTFPRAGAHDFVHAPYTHEYLRYFFPNELAAAMEWSPNGKKG